MIQVKSEDRPTAVEVLQHPVFFTIQEKTDFLQVRYVLVNFQICT